MITISNEVLTAKFIKRGATLTDVRLKGVEHGFTLGTNNEADYDKTLRYFGAIVGPVANRVVNGQIIIDGKVYQIPPNEREVTSLHGGPNGTAVREWDVVEQTDGAVTFQIELPDMDCGLPGNRVLTAQFSVEGSSLKLHLTATTDAPTPMNLANHSYWNMDPQSPHKDSTIKTQILEINSDTYLPVDDMQIPTGEETLNGHAFDLRNAESKGKVLGDIEHPGIDHNYCLNNSTVNDPNNIVPIAKLIGKSGNTLTLHSNAAGLQVYTASFMNKVDLLDSSTRPLTPYAGVALEPQGWPDAPNQAGFPSIMISPETPFSQKTVWEFDKA
ncbi:MAG: galactose mutarotase [Rhizobiales bacterium]|nr:galactose mutarotase [Hyphomicrobiales bacterium]